MAKVCWVLIHTMISQDKGIALPPWKQNIDLEIKYYQHLPLFVALTTFICFCYFSLKTWSLWTLLEFCYFFFFFPTNSILFVSFQFLPFTSFFLSTYNYHTFSSKNNSDKQTNHKKISGTCTFLTYYQISFPTSE